MYLYLYLYLYFVTFFPKRKEKGKEKIDSQICTPQSKIRTSHSVTVSETIYKFYLLLGPL